jgi:hypothetical protein
MLIELQKASSCFLWQAAHTSLDCPPSTSPTVIFNPLCIIRKVRCPLSIMFDTYGSRAQRIHFILSSLVEPGDRGNNSFRRGMVVFFLRKKKHPTRGEQE